MAACYLLRVHSHLPVPCYQGKVNLTLILKADVWGMNLGEQHTNTASGLCSFSALRPLAYFIVLWFSVFWALSERMSWWYIPDASQIPVPKKVSAFWVFGDLAIDIGWTLLTKFKALCLRRWRGQGTKGGGCSLQGTHVQFPTQGIISKWEGNIRASSRSSDKDTEH